MAGWIFRMLIIVLSTAGPLSVRGQAFNREQIIGSWTCVEVSFAGPVGETTAIEKAKRGFTRSQFIFRPNGFFLLRLPTSAPPDFKELEKMNDQMWHIRSKERMVFVGSLDEDLMTINVRVANGSYYFMIRDSPLVLKMVKTK